MKTLIYNIFKSLFQNRITKYEDADDLIEITAKEALNLSKGDYDKKVKEVFANHTYYHNKLFSYINDAANKKLTGIKFEENSHEAILILENVYGSYDKLIKLGYYITKPNDEYSGCYVEISW
jgi:hypothetical protein